MRWFLNWWLTRNHLKTLPSKRNRREKKKHKVGLVVPFCPSALFEVHFVSWLFSVDSGSLLFFCNCSPHYFFLPGILLECTDYWALSSLIISQWAWTWNKHVYTLQFAWNYPGKMPQKVVFTFLHRHTNILPSKMQVTLRVMTEVTEMGREPICLYPCIHF